MGIPNLHCCMNSDYQIKNSSVTIEQGNCIKVCIKDTENENTIINNNKNKMLNIPQIKINETTINEVEKQKTMKKEEQILKVNISDINVNIDNTNNTKEIEMDNPNMNNKFLQLVDSRKRRRVSCNLDLNAIVLQIHNNICGLQTMNEKLNFKQFNSYKVDLDKNVNNNNINKRFYKMKTNLEDNLNKNLPKKNVIHNIEGKQINIESIEPREIIEENEENEENEIQSSSKNAKKSSVMLHFNFGKYSLASDAKTLGHNYTRSTRKISDSIKGSENGIYPSLRMKSKSKKRKKADIKEIHESFTEKQIAKIKEILIHEELINDQMDDNTINLIINCISYYKVRSNTILFTNPKKIKNQKENVYYIIEKGKLEYQLDKEVYEITKYGAISTNALINYSSNSCILRTTQKSYLYILPIDKFKSISESFMDKLFKEKVEILKGNFFFKKLSSDLINILATNSYIIKYKNNQVIINEDQFSDSFYIIIEGCVFCTKNKELINVLYHGELFGEISLFSQLESIYTFKVESDTTILKLPYDIYISLFKEKAVKSLIATIFENTLSEDRLLSKYISSNNMEQIFNIFQLKFYYNDVIQTTLQRKVLLPISGWAFKVNKQKSSKHLLCKLHIKENNCLPKGKFFMECLTCKNDYPYIIIGEESVIFECNWEDLQQKLPKYNSTNNNESISVLTNLLRNQVHFIDFSLFKIFEIANSMNVEKYKSDQVILENGPISKNYYIIKNGEVEMKIKEALMKTLSKGQSFGDIFSKNKTYPKNVNFVAKNDTECYVLTKETFEDITEIDKDMLIELHDLLSMNYLNLSLDNLYYVDELGSGSYGKVNLVHDTHKLYAMKSAEILAMNARKDTAKLYINEKQIMFGLHHPFIVQLHNTYKTSTYIYFLMDYIDGITLYKYLDEKENKNSRDLNEVKFYGSILFTVLNYLQKNRVIHRDLKPDNLIIEYNGYLKVIDFGAATVLKDKDYASTYTGTPHYIAPEIILGQRYNFAVDYWSTGVILYEIFYGQIPFGLGLKDYKEVYNEITNKKLILPSDPKNADFNLLLKLILKKNPSKRLSNFKKIKELNFFRGLDFDELLKMNVKPFYTMEKKYSIETVNCNYPFANYMSNNAFINSNYMDDVKKKNKENEFLNDF